MITSSLCTGQLNYKRILGILAHSFVSPKLCEACSLGGFTFFPTGCCKMGAKFQSILLPLSFEQPLDLILLSLCSALKLLCSFQMNFFWLVLMYVQAGFKADTLESVTLTNCTLQIKPAFFFCVYQEYTNSSCFWKCTNEFLHKLSLLRKQCSLHLG